MRISNCIECKEYKYLERNGKCRSCLNTNKIYIGKSSDKVYLNKSNIHNNINIIGLVGTGKTTLQKHIINELVNYNYKLFYFDIFSEIKDNDFKNSSKINLEKNTINLFTTERNKKDKKYIDEVSLISQSIVDVIQEYSKKVFNQKIKQNVLSTLKNVIKIVIDSDYMYKFEHVLKCLMSKSIRHSTIKKKHKNLHVSNIKKINKKEHYFMINIVRELSTKLDYKFVNNNSNINTKEIVKNSRNIIFDLSNTVNNISLKSIFIIKKIYNEIQLQNKNKFIFGISELNKLYNSLNKEFKNASTYDICFINITQEPHEIPNIINKSNITICFKTNINPKTNKINISSNKINQLKKYEFLLKTPNKTIYPIKL